MRDIAVGWAISVGMVRLHGPSAVLDMYFESKVVLTWFVPTPFFRLAAHMAGPQIPLAATKASKYAPPF